MTSRRRKIAEGVATFVLCVAAVELALIILGALAVLTRAIWITAFG